jgi:SAM-dependent methyltransferase
VQQSPVPEDVSAFYEAYPVHQQKSAFYQWMRNLVMAPSYFDFRSLRKGDVLLDYGCGDGWFLESIKGKQITRVGFERSNAQAERLSSSLGVPVYSDSDRLISDFEGRVDVITMHFVVEHLTDLAQAFSHVERLLKPGGIFFFTVPNLESWEAKLFRRKWHGLDAPRHISFPHRAMVEKLGKGHNLEFVEMHTVPFPNGFAGSIPPAVIGHFGFVMYLLALPLGMVVSRLWPGGFVGYSLKRSLVDCRLDAVPCHAACTPELQRAN